MGRGRGNSSRTVLLGKRQMRRGDFIDADKVAYLLELRFQAEPEEFWKTFKEEVGMPSINELETSFFIRELFESYSPYELARKTDSYFPTFVESVNTFLKEGVPVFFDKPLLYKDNYSTIPGDKDKVVITGDFLSEYFIDMLEDKKDLNFFFSTVLPNFIQIKETSEKPILPYFFYEPLTRSISDSLYNKPIELGETTIRPISHYLETIREAVPKTQEKIKKKIFTRQSDDYSDLRRIIASRLEDLTENDLIDIYESKLFDSVNKSFTAVLTKDIRAKDILIDDSLGYALEKTSPPTLLRRLNIFLPESERKVFNKIILDQKDQLENWGIPELSNYISSVSKAFIEENIQESPIFEKTSEAIVSLKAG